MPIGEGVDKPVLCRLSEERIETLNLLNYRRCCLKLPVYFPLHLPISCGQNPAILEHLVLRQGVGIHPPPSLQTPPTFAYATLEM